MNGPISWYRGLRYSLAPGDHKGRHLSRRERAWAAEQDDPGEEWADTLHGMNQELTEEFAAAVCAPGCHEAEHRAALAPLPADPDGFWTWQPARATQTVNLPPWELEDLPGPGGARRRAASEPAMAVMPTAEADEPLYPLEMTWVAVAWARKLRRAWSALFGPDPQNLPGPVPDESAPSGPAAAGEPVLEGVIIDTPPAPEPSPSLKADLARIDAEALAVITRIDALIAGERDALHAWSGQLELTAGAA